MSTTEIVQSEPTLNDTQLQEMEGKKEGWKEFGEILYRKEISIQAQAQNRILQLKHPKSIEDVPDAEKTLAEVKQGYASIELQRKHITNRFRDVADRLMAPEKLLAEQIDLNAKEILKLKDEHEKAMRVKKAKDDEVKAVKERILNYMTDADLRFRSWINNECAAALKRMLEGNVAPHDVHSFIEEERAGVMPEKFKLEAPKFPVRYLDLNEVMLIMDETFKHSADDYVSLYLESMDATFQNYEVAFANKRDALELAETERLAKLKDLSATADNQKLATSMEAQAKTLTMHTGPVMKAVKRSYEIDMEENEAHAAKIDAQFWANISLTRSKVRASWFKLTIEQKGKALAAVKSDDNAFVPAGINFKEVAKL